MLHHFASLLKSIHSCTKHTGTSHLCQCAYLSPTRLSFGQIIILWDLLMFFCPSEWDPIGLWPSLPDEHLRIISEADLIYALCRWGHPNDLPCHGCHQSPATRGHSEHAWEREPGGTAAPTGLCVCVGMCGLCFGRCVMLICLIWFFYMVLQ